MARIKEATSQEQLLTVGAIAKLCRVHRTTVHRWLKRRGFQTSKTFGGYQRVTTHQLISYLKEEGMDIPLEIRDDSPMRVLAIDDQARALEIIVDLLAQRRGQFTLRTASDGVSGCILVGSFKPQVVILDLMMPGMDGFEVCARLSSLPPDERPRILVVTGYASPENVQKALACGAASVLAKPFTIDEFTACLDSILASRAVA